KPLKHARFLVTIYDLTNTGIYVLDSEATGGLPETLPAEGEVVCTTEPINITPGRCYVHIGLTRGSQIADHVHYAAWFDVEADDFFGTGKMHPRDWVVAMLKHQWEKP